MIPISRNRRITYTDSWQFVDLQFVDKVGVPGEVGLRVEHLLLVGVESVHGDFWHFALELGFILASGKRAKEQRCACKDMIAFYFFSTFDALHQNWFLHDTHSRNRSFITRLPYHGRETQTESVSIKEESRPLSLCLSSDLPLFRGLWLAATAGWSPLIGRLSPGW